MEPHPFWQTIGNIYCINLYEREDRYEHARKQFQGVGLLDRVVFHRVHKHPHCGKKGGFNSFLEVLHLEHSKYADGVIPKPIIIFEDDLIFKKDKLHYLDELASVIQSYTYDEWDTIRLGHAKPCFVEKITDNIFRGNALHTHASVYSPRFVERLVKAKIDPAKMSGKNIIFDQFIKNVTGKNLLTWEQVVTQGQHGSDVVWQVYEGDNQAEQLQKSFLKDSETYILQHWEHSVKLWREVEHMSVPERINYYKSKCKGQDISLYVLENMTLI